ncbi:MAG: MATE family efflux transporter [Paramuribaculum sp.]|nr:MATE family efflux transporter [Paramuribaculum sp.]
MATPASAKIDMLSGSLFKKILLFALPLVASGILQQSFNAVDVMVVGRFSSHQALAAVGSNGALINILINLFLGVSVGANVVISNYIGCKNEQGIRRCVSTVGVIALGSGVLLTIMGLTLSRPILELMNTPDDVIDLATTYLRIYFLGMPMMMVYNFGSAIMRSMGDTRRPFYALVVGGIINTLINLLLVIVFDMSVAGVAIATVIANTVNASFITYWLLRESEPFTLIPGKMKLYGAETRKMLQIGMPAGLQGMVFSIANIFIQSAINRYGSNAIAGSSAALNYEIYCYFIMVAFNQATMAFVSQNYGAGNYDRCRRAMWMCMAMSVVGVGAANVIITLNAPIFLGFFSSDPEVIHYGVIRLEYVLLLQFIASSYEISGSALRALGYSMTPMVMTVFGTCVLRLIWIHTVCADSNNFGLLLSIYPITWVITGTGVLTAYFIITRRLFAKRV